MKIFQLLVILLLSFSSLFSQNHFSSLNERFEKSEIAFEGIVLEKESFWNANHSRIYTRNFISVEKSFKGSLPEIITLISQGGEVDNDFQELSHGLTFEVGAEGLFLCKHFDVPNLGESLMINNFDGFVGYQREKLGIKIFDGSTEYNNLRKFYSNFLNPEISNNLNSFELKSTSETIEFDLGSITVNANSLEFDVYAKSSTEGTLFAGGELFLKYSTSLFGSNIVSAQSIAVDKEDVTENASYGLNTFDADSETLQINITANCEKSANLYGLSASVFEKILHFEIDIVDFFEIGSLSLDEFQMEGLVNYYHPRRGCIPFDKIVVPNPIEEFFVLSIIEHDLIVTAGTGSILRIKGTDFGTIKGDVIFKNANTNSNSFPVFTEEEDILIWNDTIINVRVPSRGKIFGGTGNSPAGSGFFKVRKPGTPSMEAQSPQEIEIKYAVHNFRNSSNQAFLTYMGETVDSDGILDNNRTFQLDSSLHFHPQAKTLIDTALCQWINASAIKWDIGPVSEKQIPANNDSTNLILFAQNNQFNGSNAEATAFTPITGTRIEPCSGAVRFIREVDILIREDLSALTPPATGGFHFGRTTPVASNKIDFYSVILHEFGHAHLLRHALPDTKVMFPFIPQGVSRRSINSIDTEGAKAVIDSSNFYLAMFPNCGHAIKNGNMCFSVTSIEEEIKPDLIKVYPNPFNNQLNFEIPLSKNFTFEIFDVIGNRVFQKYFEEQTSNFQITLTEDIPSGIYYVSIRSSDLIYSTKLLKINSL